MQRFFAFLFWVAAACSTAVHAVETVPPVAPATAKAPVVPTAIRPASKPEWQALTAVQQHALKPLAQHWVNMSEGHKRKWLTMSQNFAALPALEQTLMHERMTEWATLSAQERSQARLNYAGVKTLPSDERLAKWQAYQALSTAQKQQLAANAPTKPVGAATAVKPVAPQRLTVTPTPAKSADNGATTVRTPKIAAAPNQVDHKTLLPQQVPLGESLHSQ